MKRYAKAAAEETKRTEKKPRGIGEREREDIFQEKIYSPPVTKTERHVTTEAEE